MSGRVAGRRWKAKVCVQAATAYWAERAVRETFLAHPAAGAPGAVVGVNTPGALLRFPWLELPPPGVATGGEAVDLVWSSLLRMFADAGIPAGDLLMCSVRRVAADPVPLPVEPLRVVRRDTVWAVSVVADVRGGGPGIWPALRRELVLAERPEDVPGVEMEIAENTPGRAFDAGLARIRRACSGLSAELDEESVRGAVDAVPRAIG
ncbi:hypothetical protein MF672_011370 [Actinomadura sp. ATCC 31491]|uniref:Uncharacterized protein n=1 Tax=Actinomadura luzonensis TaxID=2805427 RepID=A0ABT0FQ03_9ACTN|nr:hypothetical protein [Actinomadura luzonensis]MCK2214385.1 hypothetical protein [Actinomadura luzonensis]